MKQLTDFADCVMPIDNQSLINIVYKVESFFSSSNSSNNNNNSGSIHKANLNTKRYDPSKVVFSQLAGSGTIISNEQSVSALKRNEKPFDSMNNIVANMLLNLTSSSRFEGSLNVDLNEITMNLVPYPRIHYLLSSLSPLYISEKVNLQVRGIEQMFSDAFKRDQQLLQCDPKSNMYLACGLMVRGNCQVSDIRKNIEKIKPQLNFIRWNQEGWKTGLCAVPAFGQPYSLLCLANNTCIKDTFSTINSRFQLLYRRKAHLHHYTQVDNMDMDMFNESIGSLNDLIVEYNNLDRQQMNSASEVVENSTIERIKILS